MSRFKLTFFVYAALVAIATTFFVVAMGFPGPLSPGDLGPARFPQAVALLLIVLVAIEWLVARSTWPELRRADITLAVTVTIYTSAAVVLTGALGFFVVVPPTLFGALWLLGERRLGLMAAYSVGFTLFIWGFFAYGLGQPIATFGA